MSAAKNNKQPPLIAIKNASVMRENTLALDSFSLSIQQGESLAILGPNGAGKSSLLKLINREIHPLVREDSFVKVLGQEYLDLNKYRRHIGIISQDLQAQYESKTPGLEAVISGFFSSNSLWHHHDITEEHIQQATDILKRLDIFDLRDRCFGELSTGQQRRLLLARALVHQPDTLILDEPTSGMDIKACFSYLRTLSELISAGRAVVLVTHHIHEIPAEIQRIVLIKEGKVLFDGDKTQALSDNRISNLFDTRVEVVEQNGLYQVYPTN